MGDSQARWQEKYKVSLGCPVVMENKEALKDQWACDNSM